MTHRAYLTPLAALLSLTVGCATDPAARSSAFVESGDRYAADGQWRAARLEYRNALGHQPDAAATHYKLALAYEQIGEPEQAFAAFARVVELDSSNVDAHLRVSTVMLSLGRYRDAEHLLNRVMLHEPDHAGALVLLAEALDGLGRPAEAAAQLERALAIEPIAAAHVLRARWDLRDGRLPAARHAVATALDLAPEAADAWTVLGAVQWRSGEVDAAENSFRQAAQLTTDPAAVDRVLASFFVMTGRPDAAEPHLLALAERNPGDRLALADYYLSIGKSDTAAPVLHALLEDSALAGEARLRRAVLARAEGRPADGVLELDAALEDRAVEPRARVLKAEWLLEAADLAGALEQAERAVALDPRSADAHFAMGMVRAARRELADAERAFGRARALSAIPGPVDEQLARLALARGDVFAAVRYAQQAADDAPGPPTHALLARTVRASGDLRRAGRIVSDALERWPGAAELETELGFVELASGRADAARLAFERALRGSPSSPEGRSGLVLAHVAGRTTAGARTWLERWRADAPDDASLAILSAQLDLVEGDAARAERTLRDAVQRTPGNTEALEALAQLYIARGERRRAIDAYERLVQLHPAPVMALTALGMLKQDADDQTGAAAAYERAIALSTDAGVAANNLAWLYAERGRLDDAARLAEQAVRALDGAPQALHTLGSVYQRQQRAQAAIRQLSQAVQKAPDNPTYRYDLAIAYLSAERPADAQVELERALATTPDFAHAADARRMLDQLAPGHAGSVIP